MAKVNVNRATHEELVEAAGLRPQVAEAVLGLRDEHGGRIADLEALKEIRGVGDATLDHLREVLVAGKRPDEGAAPKKGPDEDAAPKKGEEAPPKKSEEAPAREDAEVTALAAKSGSGDAGAAGAAGGVTAFAAKSGGGIAAAHKGAEVTAFAAKSGGDGDAARKVDDVARKGAEVTAFVARGGAEAARRAAEAGHQAVRAGAEGASRFAAAGAEQARRAVDIVAEAQRRAAERSSEAASDLGGLVVGLVAEQARHNVETFQALARARNLLEAAEIQGGYLRASVERATRGTTRYVEVVTKLAAGMATVGRDKAREAA